MQDHYFSGKVFTTMQLRDYQTEAINAVLSDWDAESSETLLVMATGLGKTNTFLTLLMRELDADPGARALVLAHRKELIDQPLDRLRLIDEAWLMAGDLERPRVGVIQAERRSMDRQLTIATVQSLNPKRTAELLKHGPITHLVVDEAHHAVANSYLRIREQLLAANPNLRHLGVTATPLRSDGDGLARVYQKTSAIVSIADGVRRHFLTQPRWLAISTGISISGVHTRGGDFVAGELAEAFDTPAGRRIIVKAYQDYAAGRRAIAFTASVAGAHDLAEAFRVAGVTAAAVDGTTPKDERARILGDFRAGAIQIVANCQVLTEGFDAPGTNCILMCRPTRSDSLYIQCLDDKTEVLTDAGWVDRSTAWMAQRAAAFNPATSAVEWADIDERFDRALAPGEQMYSIQSPTIDIRVTGGHRMLMRHRRSLDPSWRFVTTEALAKKRSEYLIPVAGTQQAPGVPLTFDELRLLGIWLSDGTMNKQNRQVSISQGEHQPQNADIVATLKACGISYRVRVLERVSQFNSNSAAVHYTLHRGRSNALAHFDPYLDKELSPMLEYATSKQLAALLEGLHIGDGIKERNVSWTRRTYHICTGNLTFAERLQSLCVRRGFRCNLATHSHNRDKPYYVLHIKYEQKRYVGGANQADREHLEVSPSEPGERVWCLSNRLQTLITRRNGKVAIVGNCMGRGLRPASDLAQPGEECLLLYFVPAETRNIVMAGDVLGLPNEQAKAVRELLKEADEEPGAAQLGFTFDGTNFDTSGTPLEIVARQLDYLTMSTLAWFPPNGTRAEGEALTIGLGEGADGVDRILAIRDGALYGLWRRRQPDGRPGFWQVKPIDCTDPYEAAEEIAARHGAATLMRKNAAWRGGGITEGQERYLRSLARGRLSIGEIRQLGKGSAAQWISHLQATDALTRYCDRAHRLTEEAA
jgi:superfamily II DNA or RNA helicase